MSELTVRSKVWLEVDGEPFLGDGRYRLLRAVERGGSISAAARELGISYRKAWAQLAAMEAHAPFPLLERRTGGKAGGATVLTDETLRLLAAFGTLREAVNHDADRHFAHCFTGESTR
ncbi:MAG: winged helix-turn-helix domain-containing protein [Desulfuromonadales bacterium]|nr:winged helix-turn-helix domain-containing protein [Desulfuromonadales bacterium]